MNELSRPIVSDTGCLKEWLTAREIAEEALPGLPSTEVGVAKWHIGRIGKIAQFGTVNVQVRRHTSTITCYFPHLRRSLTSSATWLREGRKIDFAAATSQRAYSFFDGPRTA